jgi:hypothetical protein
MSGFKNAVRAGIIASLLFSSFMLTACDDDMGASAAAGSKGSAPATTAGTTLPTSGSTTPSTAVGAAPTTSGSTSSSTSSTAPAPSVQALALTGTAASTVKVGEAFSFTPTLTGASGAVGYSIQNKPAWATFSTATGALTGTPSGANVGTYANIVISAAAASGGTAALRAFSVTVAQVGSAVGSATLSWTPPTQNTDGSAIANLAGYRIYYGTSSGAMTKSINVTNPGLTAYTVADLGAGTHYFGITAYTTGGAESGMSNIGSKTIM